MNQPLPPSHRTPLGHALKQNRQEDALVLQQCECCNQVQYPPREVCRHCLSDQLDWQAVDNNGVLLVSNALFSSIEPYYQSAIPFQLASIKLDCGPVVLACNSADRLPGDRVQLVGEKDTHGNLLLVIKNTEESA